MNKYILDLDELFESDKFFFELEKISDGGKGHICEINAEDSYRATEIIIDRLKGFIRSNLHLDN
jgi:hypothetical protein